MPTTVTALMFMPRARPEASTARDGTFQLTLRLLDRLGPGRTEAWLAHWAGPAAQTWWAQHQSELQPGTPVRVQLTCPRTHFDRLARSPEIHARVESLAIEPRHPADHITKTREDQHA
ncbi:hypothetical protein PSQ39_21285 [Curvibacter sp. HBC28]|uniref:Uncharacterized protein n=1 Tax=Curvibacter microcysteis TaxID=3026419 RepID=A0ABT5MKS4_9BURK|nr:hypothetical protein [Curvibacter sp. HBC28]MDD0817182.1 hypothetical protein [Curvibacter sp. HBC28]